MRQIIYLTLLLLFLASCQHSSQKLQLVEEIIDSQPDSALKILRNIDYKNENSNGDKALYGIHMFKALDKATRQLHRILGSIFQLKIIRKKMIMKN